MAARPMPEPEQFPNNSNAERERQAAPKPKKVKPAKVTKGKVVQKKKTFGRRFAEAFGAQEGQSVLEYILYDIIIPATKNMIVDSIIDGAEMAILGDVRGRRRRSSYDARPRYSYDRVSYRDDRRDPRDRDRDRYGDRRDDRYDRGVRGLRDYEDICFDSKGDVEEVISGLIDLIDEYGQATVGDLYDLAGVTPEYTVNNYGWTNLSSACPRHVRDGYILDLPRPILL